MKHKKNPTVLIIGEWDFAGCGYFLSQAINQHTDSKARSIRYHPSTLSFPYDILAPTDSEFRDLWKRADVIHIHDDYRPLPSGLQAKPTVVTYHGTLYRTSPKSYDDKARAMGWVQTAATLDLTILGPRWLPDTRPDMSQYVNRSPVFKCCHAPTKRKVKGTSSVLQACRGLTDLDLIENVPWEEALKRKGQCWITIDQFQLGYGCNAIEAWMMEQVVLGGATDPRTLTLIDDLAGGDLPFIETEESIEDIRGKLKRLRDDQSAYAEYQQLGQDYVNRFHSMQAVSARAMEYYHEAIETFYSRGANYPPPSIAPYTIQRGICASRRGRRGAIAQSGIAIEYLGDSIGWVPFEVNANKYKFSKLAPVQIVDPADVGTLLELRDKPRTQRGKRGKVQGALLFRRAV